MEEDKKNKRWDVAYTKHAKQKRKVYHDGFLDLHIPTNKLKLYDESEKLLECRMLRKDEVVSSAQTLTFASYFVDVGTLHCPPHRNPSDTRRKSNESSPMNRNLSPSQKIIREFKKTEIRKYVAQQTGPTATKSSVSEWQVLYATQVTQKAKKYHDGFLKLKNSGTLQRQIMLYDGSNKLVNSRFLKKDEVIQSGESVAFDGHLVNIGEAEGNHSDLTNTDARVSNCIVAGNTGMIQRVQHCLKTNKSFLKGKSQKIASSNVYADPTFSIPSIAETKSNSNISAHKHLRDATQILSILRKPMIQESIATQSINKNIMNPVPSVKEPHDSDSAKIVLECSQLPRMSIAHHGSNGKLDNIKSSECPDIKISPEISSEGKFKAHLEDSELYTKCCNEASVSGSLSRAVHNYEGADVTEDCTDVENSREASSFPSFELGFD